MNYNKLSKHMKIKLLRYGFVTLSMLGYGANEAKAQDTNHNEINENEAPSNDYIKKDIPVLDIEKVDIVTDTLSIQDKNLTTAQKAFDNIFTVVAYTENFSPTRYYCGARQTIAYGNTVLDNGKRVTKYTRPVTMERGKELVSYHVNEHVYPYLKYVERELNQAQLEAVCSFIYNVGGEYFSGKDKEGRQAFDRKGRPRKPSEFLQAINNGEDDFICAQRMLQSHTSSGKVAWGLFKRRWVEMAIYTGKLTAVDILDFKVKGLYLNDDIKKLYNFTSADKKIISTKGLDNNKRREVYKRFTPKLDEEIIKWFKEFNKPHEGQKTVSSIMDEETVSKIKISHYRNNYDKVINVKSKILLPVEEIKIADVEIKPIINTLPNPNAIKAKNKRRGR